MDFKILQMKDGESITRFFGRTMNIANKMRYHGEQIQDSQKTYISSLLVNYRAFLIDDQALKASINTHSNNSRGRGRGKGRGRSKGQGPGILARISKAIMKIFKIKVECLGHHKLGHYAFECYTKLPREKEKRDSSNLVEMKEEEEKPFLMVFQEINNIELDIWYMDIVLDNYKRKAMLSSLATVFARFMTLLRVMYSWQD
ncbi:hypothetical protein CR513_13298, partial [Mucuna pruriens]